MAGRRTSSVTAQRREALVIRVMKVLDQHNFTPFEFEGFCRHQLRSKFCLEGMSWAKADHNAAEIVASALKRVGARRPSWEEGQPRWTERGYVFIERTRCINCGWKLPEGNKLYCSSRCFEAKRMERHREQRNAQRLAWKLKRRTTHTCEQCGRDFDRYAERSRGTPRFCSRACHHQHQYEVSDARKRLLEHYRSTG